MAEIGALANIAQVIGAGLALSKTLYDFATVLNIAGRDVNALAQEVGLLSSALQQVQSTLTEAKSYRLSLSAIQTAEDAKDRAQFIFEDLEATIKKFQERDVNLDLQARIKWVFRGKRVLLVREELKTCTTTLHLMLTTLVLAESFSSKR